MSFVLALAQPSFGLVCADTRLSVKPENGQQLMSDDGILELSLPDGTTARIGSEGRKVRKLRRGWIASPSVRFAMAQWGHRLNALQSTDLDDVERALREEYAEAEEKLYEGFGNPSDELVKSVIFLLQDSGVTFEVANLRFRDESIDAGRADYYFHFPSDSSAEVVTATNAQMAHNFLPPRDTAGLCGMVRFLARMFQDVHGASNQVSNRIELGLMLRTGPGQVKNFHLLASNSEILAAYDAQILKMLRSV